MWKRPLKRRLLLIATLLLLLQTVAAHEIWKCPEVQEEQVTCTCDRPHTLRCLSDEHGLQTIANRLRGLPLEKAVSLLDVSAKNLTELPAGLFSGIALHGFVVSSGQLVVIDEEAFQGLVVPLLALGLPSNALQNVPTAALGPLKRLDRLDLSENKLVKLNSSSFDGVTSLTVLDLSDNQLVTLSPDCFAPLVHLRVLKLRGNRLGIQVIKELKGLSTVEELDLSANALTGPLGKGKFPEMRNLTTLILSSNQISSVQKDALGGASNLKSLSLNHNQIDVIEDDAFQQVKKLKQLDLSSNRIVTVSGSSLELLSELTDLDLSHNFLRALTADLIAPLSSLKILHLDDNDITTVNRDAFSNSTPIERLTLSDNPLNCDCLLANFSQWFDNSTRLPLKDRETAVCATPPSLENGLLVEIPLNELKCEENEDDLIPPTAAVQSTGHLTLRAFRYDGESITLLWTVDALASFTCDAVFVYEDVSSNDVLISSTPLKCNSSDLADPKTLTVRLPGDSYQLGHSYRYCVVLLEDQSHSDELQLLLGCSDLIPLELTKQSVAQPSKYSPQSRIVLIEGNITDGVLYVSVKLWRQNKDSHCHVTVTVFVAGALLSQHHLNCSNPSVSLSGLPTKGPFHVCGTLGNHPPAEPRVQCIMVGLLSEEPGQKGSAALTGSLVLLAIVLILVGILVSRRILKRPTLITTHQCFMAPHDVDGIQQHARYVKLHATTKV